MRTTLDIPDPVFKKAKLRSVREGTSLKDWFVAHLRAALESGEAKPDDAARFRARFKARFEPADIDRHKRAGRA